MLDTLRRIALSRRIYLEAFLLSSLSMGIAFIIFGLYPFGGKSLLTSDLAQQYIQIFSEYRNIMHGGQSIFFSWNAGMGLNFFGILSYCLLSPFNIITLVFPERFIVEAIALILIIKTGISGLTFTFYARSVLKANALTGLAFSLFYSMMSWSVLFYPNLMWHDALMVLPLVIYSVHRLIKNGRCWGLVASLTYIFVTQYYMSYIVILFAFFSFWAVAIGFHKLEEWKKTLLSFCKFLLCTLLALGISAVVLLPVIYSINDGTLLGSKLPELGFAFSPVRMPEMLFNGAFSGMTHNRFPNLYCGVITLILIPVYFANKRIEKKQKLVYAVFAGLMLLSMLLLPTNSMWQLFGGADTFLGRYTFVISFFLVAVACRGFMNLEGVEFKTCIITAIALAGYLFIAFFLSGDNLINGAAFAVSLIFIILSMVLLHSFSRYLSKIKLLHYLLIGLAFADVTANAAILLYRTDDAEGTKSRHEYVAVSQDYREATAAINAIDRNFYRMEKDFYWGLNDSLAGHYKGISHYSPNEGGALNEALARMGYQVESGRKQWVSNTGSTMASDALFSVKYKLSKGKLIYGYSPFFKTRNFDLLTNDDVLPLAYQVDMRLENNTLSERNPFLVQEKLISDMLGSGGAGRPRVFVSSDYTCTLDNADINMGKYDKCILKTINHNRASAVTMSIKVTRNDPFYLYIKPESKGSNAKLTINGEEVENVFKYESAFPYLLCTNGRGKEFQIRIEFEHELSFTPSFCYLNYQSLLDFVNKIKENTVTIEAEDLTRFYVETTAEKDKLLFTSVPYNSGWSITVNGKNAEITPLLNNAFIGVELEEGANHIEFSFTPPGVKTGTIITLISIIAASIAYIILKRKEMDKLIVN
ncbi:MAG: YfhO family protein [Oscillospiraceae bacterium]|nr:YfhO family protein [Oscillospiraceae bacterium]